MTTHTLADFVSNAGVLHYFVDHLEQATTVPEVSEPPQRSENRPYPIR